jgi:hypothetical protein
MIDNLLPTFKAELLRSCLGSIVELDPEEHNGDKCFRRFFVALKPCIDWFFFRMQIIHCYECHTFDRVI